MFSFVMAETHYKRIQINVKWLPLVDITCCIGMATFAQQL